MRELSLLLCAVMLCGVSHAEQFASGPGARPEDPGPPATLLSAYHLFSDPASQTPADGVIPYDLSAPLFSDYAAKHRFVWMPPGTSAAYHEREVFEFPVGTILVKTFAYLKDMRDPAKGERLIETRLLIRKKTGWAMFPYVWNADASDARLTLAGARVSVNWIHSDGSPRSLKYIVPNVNQCKYCHANNGAVQPIGPKARYLNHDYAYREGEDNQLARWTRAGYLSNSPAPGVAPKAPRWDDPESGTLEQRARTYLDINCAHCHNPGGPAYTSGLDLSFDQTTPMRIGVHKSPVAAGRGASIGRYDIEPGSPDTSILLYRIISTDPGVRMPVLGRNLMHEEGVALIRAWIENMPVEVSAERGRL